MSGRLRFTYALCTAAWLGSASFSEACFEEVVGFEGMCVCVCVVTAGSSTDVSEDWEKDFDLDMTEEEVQMALSKIESSGEVKSLFST